MIVWMPEYCILHVQNAIPPKRSLTLPSFLSACRPSFTRSRPHPLTNSLTHSPTHPPTHLRTMHSFTYSQSCTHTRTAVVLLTFAKPSAVSEGFSLARSPSSFNTAIGQKSWKKMVLGALVPKTPLFELFPPPLLVVEVVACRRIDSWLIQVWPV